MIDMLYIQSAEEYYVTLAKCLTERWVSMMNAVWGDSLHKHTHTPDWAHNTHGFTEQRETKESETVLNSMWTCLSLSMVQMVVFTAEGSRPTGACIISAIRLNLRLFFKTSIHAVGQRKTTSQQVQFKSNALVISKRGSDRRLLCGTRL